ncbi:MAG: hypothetical protein ACYTGH_07000 [Planctomycetota bacterium]|jgi:hypothetical protein
MAAPFLLSESGSTRATAYQFGNKVVTIDTADRKHIVFDAPTLPANEDPSEAWGAQAARSSTSPPTQGGGTQPAPW